MHLQKQNGHKDHNKIKYPNILYIYIAENSQFCCFFCFIFWPQKIVKFDKEKLNFSLIRKVDIPIFNQIFETKDCVLPKVKEIIFNFGMISLQL